MKLCVKTLGSLETESASCTGTLRAKYLLIIFVMIYLFTTKSLSESTIHPWCRKVRYGWLTVPGDLISGNLMTQRVHPATCHRNSGVANEEGNPGVRLNL